MKDVLKISDLDSETQTQLEAAAFRRLIEHLNTRTDVQNIDLMNLAGFCRNCLSKWYVAAADEKNISVDYENARERVYGMTYEEWKNKYQTPASPKQVEAFNQKKD
ncbi:MAG: DUF1244 domain-containing protein [Gammaproteobacteria bacterium]|nr:MAG: DUF1244 domain-containing protein [Gammaproteobacteria bacterium]